MALFPTRILLATDGSPDAVLAARSAIKLSAAGNGSEIHVVHVGEFLPTYLAFTEEEPAELRRRAREVLDAETQRIRDEGGSVADAHLRLGRPAEEVVNLAEELGAGLVVVGSRGLGSLRRAVLGSVSENVVRYAPCPVFVARKEGG